MKLMKHRISAITSAMKAGWIAAGCQRRNGGCIIDDATESITACSIHETEITRLANINEQANL